MLENLKLRYAHEVGQGIFAIDTAFVRDEFDSCYLVLGKVGDGLEAAFIDQGTSLSAPRLVATLEDLGLSVDDVSFIVPTHVHLDHAGGAGEMMRRCPNAKLIVHPRGSRHMIDPRALRAGAAAIYGEETMLKEYGEIVPIDPDRVIEAGDLFEIKLGGRKLLCIHTPGHAKHHMCIWDEETKGIFTGDTFGISYREFDTEEGAFVIPSTTPIQFDPQDLRDSIKKMMSYEPERIYFTHYSSAKNVVSVQNQLLDLIDQIEALGLKLKTVEGRHQKLKEGLIELYVKAVEKHGSHVNRAQVIDLLELDIELNAQGMASWLDR